MRLSRNIASLLGIGIAVMLTLAACGGEETAGSANLDEAASAQSETAEEGSGEGFIEDPTAEYSIRRYGFDLHARFLNWGITQKFEVGDCIALNYPDFAKGENDSDYNRYAMMNCGPNEFQEHLDIEYGTVGPDGVMTNDQAGCAKTEAAKFLSTLPQEEALAPFDNPELFAGYLSDIAPTASQTCGITADQVRIALESI